MNLLIAIAALCNSPGGTTGWMTTHSLQLRCQRQYIECVEPVAGHNEQSLTLRLMECVKKRKIE